MLSRVVFRPLVHELVEKENGHKEEMHFAQGLPLL